MAQNLKKPKKPKVTPLDRALNRIYRLHDKQIDLNLDRIHRLLYDLGNPHEKTPPIIHIAGTNGKGSTLAYLHAILEAAEYSLHKHTSPHLIRFNERLILNGQQISDDDLLPLIQLIEKKNKNQPITFFEFCMAMNFYAFSQSPADVVLLETGLGGRRDASNVITSPMATIITSIGMDHMKFLGDTIEEIAHKKAGIMKPGTPCFIGKQNHEQLYDVFWQHATANDIPLYHYGKDWHTVRTSDGFDLHIDGQSLSLPLPSLFGDHQIDNAALAIASLYYLKTFEINDQHVATGITKAKWPARMQHIAQGSLPRLISIESELWLDGAHNKDGALAIAKTLEQWKTQGYGIHIIFGSLKNREPIELLSPLLPFTDTISTISFDYPKARTAQETAQALAEHDITATPYNGVEEALNSLRSQIAPSSKILICGSLYLAGKILAKNEQNRLA